MLNWQLARLRARAQSWGRLSALVCGFARAGCGGTSSSDVIAPTVASPTVKAGDGTSAGAGAQPAWRQDEAVSTASVAGMMATVAAGGPGTGEARYPDACPDRQAQRLRPCSDDPDPCDLRSGYPGDEYCLRPPPAGRGAQIHVGPGSYADPAELARYLLQPGQELTSYVVAPVPIAAAQKIAYVKLSMRPGSHHLIGMLVTGQPTAGFVEPSADCGGRLLKSFPSTTTPIHESPPQGVPAPENEGLAWDIPAGASLCLDYHRFNSTLTPTLSEAWINVWFAEPASVTQNAFDMVVNAGPFAPVAAHAREILTATSEVTGDGRILTLFGHAHAATERFSVFVNDGLVYDAYDWSEPRRYDYDSATDNPPLQPGARLDGALSGVLSVHAGDRLRVACEIYNASNGAMSFGSDLRTQEMCVLFVSAIGVAINPVSEM